MRLLRYLVKNFRSVEDSGWIDADGVTALIGENESGKTNLLTPLWKLNPAREGELHPTSDYPKRLYGEIRENPGDYDFITAEFDVGAVLASQLAQLTAAPAAELIVVSVVRYFDGEYTLSFPNHVLRRRADPAAIKALLEGALNDIQGMNELKAEEGVKGKTTTCLGSELAKCGTDGLSAPALQGIHTRLSAFIPESPPKTSTIVPRLQQLLDAISEEHKSITVAPPQAVAGVKEAVLKALPKFVYYSNYGNLDSEIYLPHVVANLKRQDSLGAKEEAKARTLRVLFKFVRLEPEEILSLGQEKKEPDRPPTDAEIAATSEKKRERSILMQSASAMLTAKFKEWWKQGDYKFRFEADGNHFRIWVSDGRRPEEVELENRSTGLQWFLSFYLVFLVESEGEHESAILLLDEPGLSLHPLAQRDLSEFFDNLSKTNQLIYTTHSPFLVDADRLDRVRKVYVDDSGMSKATPDLRYGGSDKRQTGAAYAVHSALNLSVAESLLWGCQPVIVEGASDQHYLTLIKALLIGAGKIAPARELVFPPSGGAKTAKIVASMLLGRDDKLPAVILDGDESGKRMIKALETELYHEAKDRLLCTDTFVGFENSEVEDLLPEKFLADIVDRWAKNAEVNFADVVKGGAPIVPQIEQWATKENVALSLGWKVEIAKRAKQFGLLRGIAEFPPETVNKWVKLFTSLAALRS
jgi:hypothetical protein